MRARGPRTTRGPALQRVALIVSLSHGGDTGSKSHRALHRRPGRRCRGPELAPPQAWQSRGARGPAPQSVPAPEPRTASRAAEPATGGAQPSRAPPRRAPGPPWATARAAATSSGSTPTSRTRSAGRRCWVSAGRCPAGVGAPPAPSSPGTWDPGPGDPRAGERVSPAASVGGGPARKPGLGGAAAQGGRRGPGAGNAPPPAQDAARPLRVHRATPGAPSAGPLRQAHPEGRQKGHLEGSKRQTGATTVLKSKDCPQESRPSRPASWPDSRGRPSAV